MPGNSPSPAVLLKLVLLIFLSAGSHSVSAQQGESAAFPQTGATDISTATITVRDGITLQARIIRPSLPGTYPALYATTPYPLPRADNGAWHPTLGPVNWYANQGFAVVLVNVRGTGGSEGEFGYFSRDEQQDHYEVIDWIASRPWSDGRVLGYGSGYSGSSQWQMASQFSPALACIAPHNPVLDPYRELVMPGGLRNLEWISDWYETGIRDANALDPVNRLVDFDLLQATRAHPLHDDFWRIRAPRYQFGQINTPVLVLHDWSALSAGSNPALYSNLLVEWHLLIAPMATVDYSSTDFHERELLPWYQGCLGQSEETGPGTLPRIRLQPVNAEEVTNAAQWPPANSSQQSLYLSHSNEASASLSLQTTGNSTGELLSESVVHYTSETLADSLVLAGPLMLEMHLTPRNQDTAMHATLWHEAPDGSRVQIASGQLRASLRAAAGVSTYQPEYSFSSMQPFVPGRPYRLDLALGPIARKLDAGSRLVLDIALINDGTVPGNGGHQLLFGGGTASRLWLPVNEGSLRFSSEAPAFPVPVTEGPPPAGDRENGVVPE